MKYYTGVGSRSAPRDILDLMTNIASRLSQAGLTLRSGGAAGADKAFERGAAGVADIYRANHATWEAMEIAKKYHPRWQACSSYARKLHARNVFQVLGREMNEPSEFMICWTPYGCISHTDRSRFTGGTGTAISIAEAYGVPIFNLQRKAHREWAENS